MTELYKSEWKSSFFIRDVDECMISTHARCQVHWGPAVISLQVPLANQSHGIIKDCRVTWEETRSGGKEQQRTVYHSDSLALSLDPTEEYIITVTARNENGSSAPSAITIPSSRPGMKLTQLCMLVLCNLLVILSKLLVSSVMWNLFLLLSWPALSEILSVSGYS